MPSFNSDLQHASVLYTREIRDPRLKAVRWATGLCSEIIIMRRVQSKYSWDLITSLADNNAAILDGASLLHGEAHIIKDTRLHCAGLLRPRLNFFARTDRIIADPSQSSQT